MKSNQLIVGSFVVIALSIAYFLLIYLPREQELKSRQQENILVQQETNLRKQTYEICLKEYGELSDSVINALAQRAANREITEQEMKEKIIVFATSKDKIVTNCVEKRLQEYNK